MEKPTSKTVELSEAAIQKFALLHGVSVTEVRRQIQIAMLNPLVHGNLDEISADGAIPEPEEVVAACTELACREYP